MKITSPNLLEEAHALVVKRESRKGIRIIEKAFARRGSSKAGIGQFIDTVYRLASKSLHQCNYDSTRRYLDFAVSLCGSKGNPSKDASSMIFQYLRNGADAVDYWSRHEYAKAALHFKKVEKYVDTFSPSNGSAFLYLCWYTILFALDSELRKLTIAPDILTAAEKCADIKFALSSVGDDSPEPELLSYPKYWKKLDRPMSMLSAALYGERYNIAHLDILEKAYSAVGIQDKLPVVKTLRCALAELGELVSTFGAPYKIPRPYQREWLRKLHPAPLPLVSPVPPGSQAPARSKLGNCSQSHVTDSATVGYEEMWADFRRIVGSKRVEVWTNSLHGRRKSIDEVKRLARDVALVIVKRRGNIQIFINKKRQPLPTSDTAYRIIEHTLKNGGVAGDIHEIIAAVRNDPQIIQRVQELKVMKAALAKERDIAKEEALRKDSTELESKLESLESGLKSCISRSVNRFLHRLHTRLSAPMKAGKGVKGRAQYTLATTIYYCLVVCS